MKKMRHYLIDKDLTVKDFSEILDITPTYLSGIVNGKYLPSRKLARNIAKATNGEIVFDLTQKDTKESSQLIPSNK
jgi:transcriptional regulator with XRE-family HTH domain